MGIYSRVAVASVIAMPCITVALWLGSRLTSVPWSFKAAMGGGALLAAWMFLSLFTRPGRHFVRRD